MKFTKMHGCGNDYVFVEANEIKNIDLPELAVKISDRKKGIGSDGLIIIAPSDIADIKMIMYNADGSRGLMCGNGIRCLAKYVFERKLVIKTRFYVETDSGIKEVRLSCEGREVKKVKVDMGTYSNLKNKKYILDGNEYYITYLEVGNPHCVIFVPDVKEALVEKVGSYLEKHEDFEEGVNTEFVQIVRKDYIKLRVWERGSKETMACGTGACAAFAAGNVTGVLDNNVLVSMAGGSVYVNGENEMRNIYLTGDANEVYRGEWKHEGE